MEQSLQDIVERIVELPEEAGARELHTKARTLAFGIAGWSRSPPTQEQRAKALGEVLSLNIEVIQAGRLRRA